MISIHYVHTQLVLRSLSLLGVVSSLGTEHLQLSVLLLLSLLSGRLVDRVGKANSDKSVMWLKLLGISNAVVDETESSGLSSTVLGLESKDGDGVLLGLVDLGELLGQLSTRHVSSVWVDDVHNKLSSLKQRVRENSSGSDGNGVRHCSVYRLVSSEKD